MASEKTNISINLANALLGCSTNQAELARKSKVERAAISRILTGATKSPHPDTLARIASALMVPVESLLSDSIVSAAEFKKLFHSELQDEFDAELKKHLNAPEHLRRMAETKAHYEDYDRLKALEAHIIKVGGPEMLEGLGKVDVPTAKIIKAALGLSSSQPSAKPSSSEAAASESLPALDRTSPLRKGHKPA